MAKHHVDGARGNRGSNRGRRALACIHQLDDRPGDEWRQLWTHGDNYGHTLCFIGDNYVTTMDTHFVSRLHASKQPRLVRDPFSPHMVGKSSPYICRAERRSSKPSPFLHHRPPALDVDSQMRACIHEMPVPCVLWRAGDGSDRGRQYLQIIGAVQPTRLILACHHMHRGYRADADHETGQGLLFWLPSVVSGLLMQQLLATVRAIPARIGLRST